MTRFSGKIAYAESVEVSPGIWDDRITEYPTRGKVVRKSRIFQDDQQVNDNISVGNQLSVVSNDRLRNNFIAIEYITYAGARWKVAEVTDTEGPRILLRLGGLYHGPEASTTDTP